MVIIILLVLPNTNYLLNGEYSEQVSPVIVLRNQYLGFYGTIVFNDSTHFLYASGKKNIYEVTHYAIEDGIVKVKSSVEEDFRPYDTCTCLSISKQSKFFFTYHKSIKNETSFYDYEHNYYCYVYNALTQRSKKLLLLNVNEYVYGDWTTSPILYAPKIVNNSAVFFIISSNSKLNTTGVFAISVEDFSFKKQKVVINKRVDIISCCFNSKDNSIYILFEDLDNYTQCYLYQYNCTNYSFNLYANCTFSSPNISKSVIRGGRLLYNDYTDDLIFVSTISTSSSLDLREFLICNFNFSNSTFEFFDESKDALLSRSSPLSDSDVFFFSDNEYFDAIIENNNLKIIYLSPKPHSSLKESVVATRSLNINETWSYDRLTLQDDLNPFHSSFIYNSTSNKYLDSFSLCCIIKNPPYKPSCKNDIVTSLMIYGNLAEQINNPYLINLMNSSTYHLLIIGFGGAVISLALAFFYMFKRIKNKNKRIEK
ncbi:MAG: hypothetical protein ACTSQE_10670 [Candidatus Heimdallarchaeaceae archaeon]